jgi:putative mRNA 3-end processing factor
MAQPLLHVTERGLYCPGGDFYIDPWQPVPRAVITHAHSDHARPGCGRYLTSTEGAPLLRLRAGLDALIRGQPYGETLQVGNVRVSLHPAGHLLGSAQVRIEENGEIWVVSGDYKVEHDRTCTPFELVPCHTFITESTFGLPIYRWRPQEEIFDEINGWWRANQVAGRTSLLFGYALGKAQRLLAGLDPVIGPILLHGAVQRFTHPYIAAGIELPPTHYAGDEAARRYRGQALVIAPPSAGNSPAWLRKFGDHSLAFASGWMQIRGARRRRAIDRGFALSDHADWPGLLSTIHATGAEHIGVTHGYSSVLVRFLREQGLDAEVWPTRYEGEAGGDVAETDAATHGNLRISAQKMTASEVTSPSLGVASPDQVPFQ